VAVHAEKAGGEHESGAFAQFVHSESAGSVALLAASVMALVWANSPWAAGYFHLAHVPLAVSAGGSSFALSIQHWVNDLLMALFFFVVGLEIKRELVVGELSTPEKATLPALAAIGGLLLPAGIYAVLNTGGPGSSGWGVPMATDIAFALGVVTAFGTRVPAGLKVFLAALAIADDLGAVVVIAVFYTETIRPAAIAVAVIGVVLLAIAANTRVRNIGVYVLLWLLVWIAVTASNLHPTLAGVLTAFAIPVRSSSDSPAMGETLEANLHPVVAFGVLPLFAFFNAGVTIDAATVREVAGPVGSGILLGLVIGKQVGIMVCSRLAVALGRAALPDGVTWTQVYGVACLAGIGFTMSLFVTDLAFVSDAMAAQAKTAILLASIVAAVWGATVLRLATPSQTPAGRR
jgi:NhaA family Na+:H+ antiporter